METKRTSFEGHTNLAFVYLHKNDAEAAIDHFRKAADYAPNGVALKIHALENLARAHFAAQDYPSARSVMRTVVRLREDNELASLPSLYN